MIIDAPTFLGRLFGQESAPDQSERPPAIAIKAPESITPDDLTGDWRELYEERAAVREYHGGQAREHAEAEAIREIVTAMQAAGELP